MNYTSKYFKDSMPDWKKRKDPVISRFFYRPVSFRTASIAAGMGISANTVSYFSVIWGILACSLFLFHATAYHIIAAIMINIWLILDCTDGNLARSVRSQPFGEFADGISSYILVGLMCTAMGYSVYQTGGVIVAQGSVGIVLIGALASSSDTMMRLIYQKYKATEREMVDKGIIKAEKDKRTDPEGVSSLRVRLEAELGIGGILPFVILLAAIFNALDLIVIYCFVYYGASCVVASLLYIRKAIRHTKTREQSMQ